MVTDIESIYASYRLINIDLLCNRFLESRLLVSNQLLCSNALDIAWPGSFEKLLKVIKIILKVRLTIYLDLKINILQ